MREKLISVSSLKSIVGARLNGLARVGETVWLNYFASHSRALEITYASTLRHSEILLAIACSEPSYGLIARDGSPGLNAASPIKDLSSAIALAPIGLAGAVSWQFTAHGTGAYRGLSDVIPPYTRLGLQIVVNLVEENLR